VRVKETVTIGAAEEVTTPAGKFTATPRVHIVTEPKDSGGYTAWYADGVGLVRHTLTGQKEPAQELKAFTPAKK
jgi:hypothetical protein